MWYKYVPVGCVGCGDEPVWYNTGITAHGPKPADSEGVRWLRPWESC